MNRLRPRIPRRHLVCLCGIGAQTQKDTNTRPLLGEIGLEDSGSLSQANAKKGITTPTSVEYDKIVPDVNEGEQSKCNANPITDTISGSEAKSLKGGSPSLLCEDKTTKTEDRKKHSHLRMKTRVCVGCRNQSVSDPALLNDAEQPSYRPANVSYGSAHCKLTVNRGRKSKLCAHVTCALPETGIKQAAADVSLSSGTLKQEVENRRDAMQLPKKRGRRPGTVNKKTLEKLGALNNTLLTVEGQELVSNTIGIKREKKKRGRRPGTLNKKTLEKLGALNNTLLSIEGQKVVSNSIDIKGEKKKRVRRPGTPNKITLEKLAASGISCVADQEAGRSGIGDKPATKRRGRRPGTLNRKTLERLAASNDNHLSVAGSGSIVEKTEKKKRGKKPGTLNKKTIEKLAALSGTPTLLGQETGNPNFGSKPEIKVRGSRVETLSMKSHEKYKVMWSETVKKQATFSGSVLSPKRKQQRIRAGRTRSKCEVSERVSEQNVVNDALPTGLSEQWQEPFCISDSEEPKRMRARRGNNSCALYKTEKSLVAVRDCSAGTMQQNQIIEVRNDKKEHGKKRGRPPRSLNRKNRENLKGTTLHRLKGKSSKCLHPSVTVKEIPNSAQTSECTQVVMSVCSSVSKLNNEQHIEEQKNEDGIKTGSLKACHCPGLPNPAVRLQNCDKLIKKTSATKVSHPKSVVFVNESNVEQLVSVGDVTATQNTNVSTIKTKGLEISVHPKSQNQKRKLIRVTLDLKRPRKVTLHHAGMDSPDSSSSKNKNIRQENKYCNVQYAENELNNTFVSKNLDLIDKGMQQDTFGRHELSSFCGSWRTPAYLVSEEEYSDDSLSVIRSPFTKMSPCLTPPSHSLEDFINSTSCQRVEPFTGKTIWKCSCARTRVWTFSREATIDSKNTEFDSDDQSWHWKTDSGTPSKKKKRDLLVNDLPTLDCNPSVPDLEGFISRSCSGLKSDVPLVSGETNKRTILCEPKKSVLIPKTEHNYHVSNTSEMFTVPELSHITEIKPEAFILHLTDNEKKPDLNYGSLFNVKEISDMSHLDFFGSVLSKETCSSPFSSVSTANILDNQLDIRDQAVDIFNPSVNTAYHTEDGAFSGITSNSGENFHSKDCILGYANVSGSDSKLKPSPEKKVPVSDIAPSVPSVAAPNVLGGASPEAPCDEAPCDAAPEAPCDAAPEAPCDAAPEAPCDAAPEAPCDAAPEAPCDAAPEAPCDAAPEAPCDAAPEASCDNAAPDVLKAYEDDVLIIDVIPDDPDLFGSFSEDKQSPEFCNHFTKNSTSKRKPKYIPKMSSSPQEAVYPEHKRSESPMEISSDECSPILNHFLTKHPQNTPGRKSVWTHALNPLLGWPGRLDDVIDLEDQVPLELPNQGSSELDNQNGKSSCVAEHSPIIQQFLPNNPIPGSSYSHCSLQTESLLNENCPNRKQDFHKKGLPSPEVMNPDSSENYRHENNLNKPLQQIKLPNDYCKFFFTSRNGCFKKQCLYLHVPKQSDEKLCMDLLHKMMSENRTSFLQRAFLIFIEYYSKYLPRTNFDESVFNILLDQLIKLSWWQEVLHLLETATSATIVPSIETLIKVFEYIGSSGLQVAVPTLMGIFSKCLEAGMSPTLPDINHMIATVNQLPNPTVPNNFLLSVKSKIEAHLPKKSLVQEFEAATGQIEHCKANSDWVKLGNLYVNICTGCENLKDLRNLSRCFAKALMKESVDDSLDVPYCEFADTIFKHPQLNEVHRTIVGTIGISVMFFYYRKELWQKGRRVLFKFRELKINYKVLKGITGQEIFASRCAVVNVAVEIFLMCGRLNSAVQTLKECDWIINSAMGPCDKMDVLKRHSLLCTIVQEALCKSMYNMCFEVLQNLPGFKESKAEFSVSQYNVLFNKVLSSAVSNRSLSISSTIVEFMVLKKVPIDYLNLRELIAALGHSGLWHKARDQYKCALTLGFYSILDGYMKNILYIPSFMSAVEMLLTIERFMVSNSSIIKLPDGCSQNLQIILKKIFKEEHNSKGKDDYHTAAERLFEASRLSSPKLFIKHLTVNNSGEQVYTLDNNCCVKWLNENINWAVKTWSFH